MNSTCKNCGRPIRRVLVTPASQVRVWLHLHSRRATCDRSNAEPSDNDTPLITRQGEKSAVSGSNRHEGAS